MSGHHSSVSQEQQNLNFGKRLVVEFLSDSAQNPTPLDSRSLCYRMFEPQYQLLLEKPSFGDAFRKKHNHRTLLHCMFLGMPTNYTREKLQL